MNDLYAAVIHDVKNQLAELALRLGERADAQQEMLIAMNAARRLSEMLLVIRQKSELLNVNPDSVDTADFLMILAAEYRELFPALVIDIETEHTPAFAFFDDALVRLALSNALHNACRSARTRVRLAAREQDKMLVLEVADDGPGFPDSMLENKANTPASASNRGTGLGLYLARKIAELHKLEGRCGRIELSNDGGAVFRMFLP
ncbi:MAG: ATP-binding protein [Gallionella sp.]|jgi:signal transduction histidine kinase|nr:ATP-binding protein [Gallionella sp.]MCK9354005.1 ATP-binding protein [Gallionella sp.]